MEPKEDYLKGCSLRARAIIQGVLQKHKLGPLDFFSHYRVPHLVEARIDAAQQLNAIGYSHTRIGNVLHRNRSTIQHYLTPNVRVRKREHLRKTRALATLDPEIRSIVIEYAAAENVAVHVLMAQWVSERARFEAEAKARHAA